MSELPRWITDPALEPAWRRIRARFEKAGLSPVGAVTLPLVTRVERHALSALLARTIVADRVRIELADLDVRLWERSGVGGLAAVLTRLGGQAPVDRPALRAARDEGRERPLALAAELVDTHWAADWIAGLRRTGQLSNREDAEQIVTRAAAVLRSLVTPGASPQTQSRVELGARLLGDAHGLDRDRIVHHVVVRGLAAALGVPVPDAPSDREALWAAYGVQPDLLSRTCLVWGLRLEGDSGLRRRLDLAADSGDPVHITEWDLRRATTLLPVFHRALICENPRVLEAMAQTETPGWIGVCTSGEPNLVVRRILSTMRDLGAGAELAYHGDFDWPGIGIANRIIDRYHLKPLRMSVEDYLGGISAGSPTLVGPSVEPSWDPELGAAMRLQGRVVHEEAVLTGLLDALRDAQGM